MRILRVRMTRTKNFFEVRMPSVIRETPLAGANLNGHAYTLVFQCVDKNCQEREDYSSISNFERTLRC